MAGRKVLTTLNRRRLRIPCQPGQDSPASSGSSSCRPKESGYSRVAARKAHGTNPSPKGSIGNSVILQILQQPSQVKGPVGVLIPRSELGSAAGLVVQTVS